MVQVDLTTEFPVVASERENRFFPYGLDLPKPGQWVYIQNANLSIPRFLAQVTGVNIELRLPGVYDVTVIVNKESLKEDVLFAKLARRQFNLIERSGEVLEPLYFAETLQKSETLTISIFVFIDGYSGSNYSGGEYSFG